MTALANAPSSPAVMPSKQAQALSIRLWLACLATQELLAAYLGARLGLYDAIAAGGPATVAQLTERAGIAPRYAREWLEQQSVAGLLAVDDVNKAADLRVYSLPPGHADVLTISDNPASIVSLAMLPLGGVAAALPSLLEAYRTGDGVPDEQYGDDWRNGHSGANRALFTHFLVPWLRAALPYVHVRLTETTARVADVACGAGWAGIAIALAYPGVHVDGFDFDAQSIEFARRNAAGAGVADRVTFHVRDAGDPTLAGSYDLVCLFDALHEIAHPVPVLRACRALRSDGGTVVVMDAKVAESFTAPANEVERFQYATSVLHCLPACLAGADSAGTGTVMRVGTVREYARAAGFGDAEVLPIEDRFHRFYRLR